MSSKDRKDSSGSRFGSSFSVSIKGDHPDLEESFQIGDFSAKHFTRKSSIFTIGQEDTVNSAKTKRIEGGFDDNMGQSFKSSFTDRHNNSGLTNLISSSVKRDSFLDKPKQALASTTSLHSVQPSINALQSIASPKRDTPDIGNLVSSSPRIVLPEVDVVNPDPTTVEVVGRHLVNEGEANSISANDDFDSLQLQGGDISREVYNWQKEHSQSNPKRGRSQSFSGSIHSSTQASITEQPSFQVHDIRVPGGFRRSFLTQKASRPGLVNEITKPSFVTRNFIEFLTLYGHFAGEELRDEDDYDNQVFDESVVDEETALVTPRSTVDIHKATTPKAVLLLLKAFIGTGVLFLPRGFRNSGWLFAVLSLVFFAILSYRCFMLLINVRIKLKSGSYGDIGGKLYGSTMRSAILTSIVLSQIGFAAAYIVFTASNLQAFFVSVAGKYFSIEIYILLQLLIFIPLSLTRKISKLSGTALIADLFILLGLLYVYYHCSFVVATKGIGTVKPFNDDWTLFIGTAIFTYEGVGLLIPIQESMRKPSKFPIILLWVIAVASLVFISSGLVGYLAFGNETETVILLNFPQDSILVSIVQFLYATAILLSTPLQLFPAIRILENSLIKKSGKYDASVKWQKNYFRSFLVLTTALIAWGGANDLDKFVAIVGSFACIPLIYIFPPLLHYKGLADSPKSKALDLIIATFGLGMMIYTSFQTVSGWISS